MPNGKKGLSLAMSLFMSTSAVLVNPNVRIVNAAGVMKTSSNGVGGIEVHYANNGANPNNLPYGKDVKVEDVVNIKVTFPADYGTMNKKVTINYEFNPAQKISWGGRPFYWFSLPRGVDEPSKITLYNKGKEKKEFTSWDQWMSNSRFVSSRYQNISDSRHFNDGKPDAWEKYNNHTGEYRKSFNSSLNREFNKMLDDHDRGWYDNAGNTRAFAQNIRKMSRSIYVDWEKGGDGPVNITVETEVNDPLITKQLEFGAGVFHTLGNIRIANLQQIKTPHVLTMAEKFEFTLPNKITVKNVDDIGADNQQSIQQKIHDANADKLQYLAANDGESVIKSIIVDKNGKTTIKYKDTSVDVIDGSRLVEKYIPYNERFGLNIPRQTQVDNLQDIKETERQNIKEAIYEANKNNPTFLEGIENNKDKIVVDKKGNVTVTYKDNTKHNVPVEKLIYRYVPLKERFEPKFKILKGVVDKNQLTKEERDDLRKKLWELNNDIEFRKALTAEDDIKITEQGDAIFEYGDESKDFVSAKNLIYQIPKLNDQYEPKLVNRTAVSDPSDIKDPEIAEIKKKLKEANPDIIAKLKNGENGITIDKNGGKATFEYTDGTKDEIAGNRLVYKKGSSASSQTEWKEKDGYKYKLTPIKLPNWDVLNDGSVNSGYWADAARRFVYDNYTWTGKLDTFEKEKEQEFLKKGGSDLSTNTGWPLSAIGTGKNIKPVEGTKNIGIIIGNPFRKVGILSVKSFYSNIEFRGSKTESSLGDDQLFQLSKDEVFYVDDPFDADQAKKEADKIIDDLKNNGLSDENADKLKKDLEDKTKNGQQLTKEDVEDIIKKAGEQAEKDKKQKELDDAKNKAKKEIGKLTDLANEEKDKAKEKVEQANNIDDINNIVDQAHQDDAQAKAKKEADKIISDMKQKANEAIDKMDSLDENEKGGFKDKIKQATTEKQIDDIIKEANEKNTKKENDKALEKAKQKAKETIAKLDNLSQKEKEEFTNNVTKANEEATVNAEVDKAIKKNDQNKQDLEDAKNKVRDEIDHTKYLTDEDKENFKKDLVKADSKEKVQSISDQVKAKELERAKEKLKKDIEDSKDLTPDQKNNYKNEIANAGSVDEAENKYKEASNEIANKKAEDTKKEADKLKDAYKKMINDLQGVDQKKKDNWIKQIENAGSKQEMDSIVEFARTEEKRNQAKRTIDDLKHLNKNQKADLKDMIDQLASDDDISMTVEKAEYLDDKMNTLQELVTKAKSQEIQERKNKATTDAKTNFEKALTDSEQVSDLNNGRNADDAEVDDLINRLIDTMNKLQPNETKVEVPVSKAALEREIKRSEETKKQDLYNNASKQIKEAFDQALNKAKQVLEDKTAKQNDIDEALHNLLIAKQNLDGQFELEKKDNTAANISIEAKDNTEVKKDSDKKAILGKINGIPKDATITYSTIKTVNGKKVVSVTVTKDGVTKTIDVEVNGDTTKPTLTITNADNPTVTKGEGFTEIKIEANDNVALAKDGIKVTGLADWLTYDEVNKKIVLKTGSVVPNDANNATITVTVKDEVGNEISKSFTIKVQSQADKYNPTAKEDKAILKVKGSKSGLAKEYIKSADDKQLPDSATYKWKEGTTSVEEISFDTLGQEIEKEIEVSYKDGSKEVVKVKFKVAEDIKLEKKDNTAANISIEAKDNNEVKKDSDKEAILGKINGIPKDATITYSPIKTVNGKKVVSVTVTKDGVTKTIDVEVQKLADIAPTTADHSPLWASLWAMLLSFGVLATSIFKRHNKSQKD